MICTLLSDAYEAWSGGLTDLLLWNSSRVRFVEIKGPGDSLSDRQRAWGEKLHLSGAEMSVCYVTWQDEDEEGRSSTFIQRDPVAEEDREFNNAVEESDDEEDIVFCE